MASKLNPITLTDLQESAVNRYATLHAIAPEDMIVRDYIDGNLVPAHLNATKDERLAAIAQKRAALDDPTKQAALDATLKQIELTKTAEILDEQEAAAEAMDSGKDIEVSL